MIAGQRGSESYCCTDSFVRITAHRCGLNLARQLQILIIAPRCQARKSDSLGPSSRANAMDLRRISPGVYPELGRMGEMTRREPSHPLRFATQNSCRMVVVNGFLIIVAVSQRSRIISDKNHVRRSVSSIQVSIKLAVATSLCRSQTSCVERKDRVSC